MNLASRPPLRRLLYLDRLLREKRYPNARCAAQELEVNPRTIHRDLVFLRDSWGAPLAFDPRRNGYYYRDADFALPLLRMTEGELFALFLAERLMDQYRELPFAKDLATAFQKLTASLPDEVTIDLGHLSEAYSFRSKPASTGEAARFRQLARAVSEERQLELLYWSASRDETARRVVDPYHLVSVEGDWYLVAYCHLREEVRMFAPGRIRSLKETGGQFKRPTDFGIGDYLDTTFKVVRGDGPLQRVRLRFVPEMARYVREKVWHPSQQVQQRRDGSLVLSLKVNHLLEVKRWALSYGAACEVLEPEELRSEIEAELREMMNQYRGEDS